jgi:hypothetical protein
MIENRDNIVNWVWTYESKGKEVSLHAMDGACGERCHSCYSSLSSKLKWSASRPGRPLPPGKEPRYP